jgi:hypothetical protein
MLFNVIKDSANMKNIKITSPFLYFVILMLVLFIACNEYNEPTSIFQSDKSFPANPTIISISPADHILLAGINGREIAITGNNFSTEDSSYIYFNGTRGLIKSITPSTMIVYRPLVYGDSIPIAIEVPSALGPAHSNIKYKIERPIYPYLSAEVRLTPHTSSYKFYCMLVGGTIGTNEILYVSENKAIYQLTQVTTNEKQVENISEYKSKDAFLPAEFTNISDMKFGPDDSLYFTSESGSGNNLSSKIYRTIGPPIGTPGSIPETFVTLGASNVRKLDFNQNIIYCGFKNGIYMVNKLNRKFKSSKHYLTLKTINELHVYNGYIYVAVSNTSGSKNSALWRNRIISVSPDSLGISDSLGVDEPVIDVAQTSPCNSNTTFSSFAMDRFGTLYLCLQNPATSPLPYSLYVYENNALVPFYYDNIIPPYVDQIVWGKNQDVYLNRGLSISGNSAPTSAKDSVRIFRMGMGIQGAAK